MIFFYETLSNEPPVIICFIDFANPVFSSISTKTLKNAISQLDERSKDIISSRWLVEKKATLHELAAIHNISAERVRQIENTAIKKLKKSIKN